MSKARFVGEVGDKVDDAEDSATAISRLMGRASDARSSAASAWANIPGRIVDSLGSVGSLVTFGLIPASLAPIVGFGIVYVAYKRYFA